MSLKTMCSVVLTIVAFFAILFILNLGALGLTRFFAPANENVRRITFEQSKAYNQGMIQELQNMQFEYIKSDVTQKKALASIILHRAADYPSDKLPNDLYIFIEGLKHEI